MARLALLEKKPDIQVPDPRAAIESISRPSGPDVDLGRVGDTIRRTVEAVVDRAADLPKRPDVLAAVPGGVDLARRVPALHEVASAAVDARDAAVEAALDAARRTPLRDRVPGVRRGPGPIGIAVRVALGAALAGGVAFLIANRDRVGDWLADLRTRLAAMTGRGSELDAFDPSLGGGAWTSDDLTGATAVDEVVLVETTGTSLASDQPVDDLDAVGWGTEGQPSAARDLSADVTAMTTPSPLPHLGDPRND